MVIMGHRLSDLQVLVAMYFTAYICLGSLGCIMGASLPNVQCMVREQEALLRFKKGLVDHGNRLSSWALEEEADCCKWEGVKCNHTTGHVMALDLKSQRGLNESLQGELNDALLDLPYLTSLDLSLNNFERSEIPHFIGSLTNLRYLNLSHANFRGNIPSNLGNLSRLRSLDLRTDSYYSLKDNLDWLQGLSSLEVLDLGGVDLSNEVNWLNAINMLPSLVELHLFACNLNKLSSSLPHVNFTSLQVLDLSLNHFYSSIPLWLFNISHTLAHLNLTRSHLQGPIPDAFGNMTSLAILDLSVNNLEGELPTSLGLVQQGNQLKGPSSLRELHLSYNRLNGTLVPSLGLLSKLAVLDVAYNRLAGTISEAHFSNLSSLRVLNLNGNSLVINMSSSWIPLFRLHTIDMGYCHLGPLFPEWLRTQAGFVYIDISEADISDTVPNWFWNLSTKAEVMRLYYNKLKGKVPDLSSFLNLSELDLWENSFDGPLPRFSANMKWLDLGGNSFSGDILHICESIVPSSSLQYLVLHENNLTGQLPDCWMNAQSLFDLYLSDNRFYGGIPDSIGHLPLLLELVMSGNMLSGEFPVSLRNSRSLILLDLGQNRFSGSITAWIGESSPNLVYLNLDSNNFSGTIPLKLCQLRSLKMLNLSLNHIGGTIPQCINNMRSITTTADYDPFTAEEYYYANSACFIDLSSNNLSGEIPRQVTSLVGLEYLNLSNNHLTGPIPRDIGAMSRLRVLDLSRNELSCSIPPINISDFPDLTADLSHNNLSGRVPPGVVRKFGKESIKGNPNLCGPQTTNDCSGNVTYEDAVCRGEVGSQGNERSEGDNGDGLGTTSIYLISIATGFVTGCGGFCVFLLINTSWRVSYHRYLDNHCNKLSKKFQSKRA